MSWKKPCPASRPWPSMSSPLTALTRRRPVPAPVAPDRADFLRLQSKVTTCLTGSRLAKDRAAENRGQSDDPRGPGLPGGGTRMSTNFRPVGAPPYSSRASRRAKRVGTTNLFDRGHTMNTEPTPAPCPAETIERLSVEVDIACAGFGPAVGGFLTTLCRCLDRKSRRRRLSRAASCPACRCRSSATSVPTISPRSQRCGHAGPWHPRQFPFAR